MLSRRFSVFLSLQISRMQLASLPLLSGAVGEGVFISALELKNKGGGEGGREAAGEKYQRRAWESGCSQLTRGGNNSRQRGCRMLSTRDPSLGISTNQDGADEAGWLWGAPEVSDLQAAHPCGTSLISPARVRGWLLPPPAVCRHPAAPVLCQAPQAFHHHFLARLLTRSHAALEQNPAPCCHSLQG